MSEEGKCTLYKNDVSRLLNFTQITIRWRDVHFAPAEMILRDYRKLFQKAFNCDISPGDAHLNLLRSDLSRMAEEQIRHLFSLF